MGIGVQGEPGGVMTEHTGDSFDVHAVLQGQGCEGMAEVVESDLGDAYPLENTLEHIVDTIRRDRPTVG